jgi:hypothetical protein
MFGRTIVVSLVLLVVALNVVAFVTRMMEKRRPDESRSDALEDYCVCPTK